MSLSESKQDASLIGTYEARPGVGDATSAGVSSSTNCHTLTSSVKNSLDTVAESSPSTPSMSEKLPSAQEAADAINSGVTSLLAGVSSLALGVNDAVAHNASTTHPESVNAPKVDDLHIPGAFENATSDSEDIAAVKQGGSSAFNTIPSMHELKNSLPNTEAISEQIPRNPLRSFTNQSRPQKATNHGVDSFGGSSHEGQIHKDGINQIKEKMDGQATDSVGGDSQQGQFHHDGINHIKEQIRSQHINSVGPVSTTSHLASKVPLEPHVSPQIIAGSQRMAGVSPEAAADAETVQEKTSSRRGLAGSLAAEPSSTRSAAAATVPHTRERTSAITGTDPVAVLPTSVQESIDRSLPSSAAASRSHASSSPPPQTATEMISGSHSDGVDLHTGIHNGVVGDHLDDHSEASHRTSSGSHSGHWQPGTSATVTHIPSLRDVDLSAGSKNTVVGSGADGNKEHSE